MRWNICPIVPSGVQHAIAIRPPGRQTRVQLVARSLRGRARTCARRSRSRGRSCRPRTAASWASPSMQSISTIASAARSRAISSSPGAKSSPVVRAPAASPPGAWRCRCRRPRRARPCPAPRRRSSTTASPASRIFSATAAKLPVPHISLGSMAADYGGLSVLRASGAPATLRRMDSIVTAADVRRRYGEGDAAVDALAGVSTGFERGRFTAIMGPSGSGKSTLMHILAGLDRPDLGHGRRSTARRSPTSTTRELTKLRRDKLGFVFQFFNLLPVLTAEENLVLPLSIAGRKPDDGVARAADRHRRPRGPPHPPALRALRRPAAARRGRPRAGLASRPSSSPTSRPATSTRRRATTCCACCARPSTSSARRW